jgi:hypothetical protein
MKLLLPKGERLCEYETCTNWAKWKVQSRTGDYLFSCHEHVVNAEKVLHVFRPSLLRRFLASL